MKMKSRCVLNQVSMTTLNVKRITIVGIMFLFKLNFRAMTLMSMHI